MIERGAARRRLWIFVGAISRGGGVVDGVDPSRSRGSISMRGSRCFEDQEVGVAALHNSPGVCSWPCLRANRSSRSTAIIIEADVADRSGWPGWRRFLVEERPLFEKGTNATAFMTNRPWTRHARCFNLVSSRSITLLPSLFFFCRFFDFSNFGIGFVRFVNERWKFLKEANSKLKHTRIQNTIPCGRYSWFKSRWKGRRREEKGG